MQNKSKSPIKAIPQHKTMAMTGKAKPPVKDGATSNKGVSNKS